MHVFPKYTRRSLLLDVNPFGTPVTILVPQSHLLGRCIVARSDGFERSIAFRVQSDVYFSHVVELRSPIYHLIFQAVLGRPGTPICSAALAGGTGLPSLCAKVGSECAALRMGNRPG